MYDIENFSTAAAAVAIVSFNPKTKKFTKVNKAFIDLVGYPEERLLNEIYSTFLLSDDLDESENYIATRTFKISEFVNYVNRYVHGITGEIVTVLWISDSLGYKIDGEVNTSFVINISNLIEEYSKAVLKKDALIDLYKILKQED